MSARTWTSPGITLTHLVDPLAWRLRLLAIATLRLYVRGQRQACLSCRARALLRLSCLRSFA